MTKLSPTLLRELREKAMVAPAAHFMGGRESDKFYNAADPTTVLSLLDAIATMKETMEYFVARCEIDPVKGMHPDGFIRSKKTYGKFKAALAAIFDEEG